MELFLGQMVIWYLFFQKALDGYKPEKEEWVWNMTENFQSKSARTLYIYINMSTV